MDQASRSRWRARLLHGHLESVFAAEVSLGIADNLKRWIAIYSLSRTIPMRYSAKIIHLALIASLTLFASAVQAAHAQSPYTPITKYDPKRDAAQDIRDA